MVERKNSIVAIGAIVLFCALVYWIVSIRTKHAVDYGRLPGYITSIMKDWQVPGLAIAIVHNNTIEFMSGFGVLKHGENVPVDKDTIFAIGSCSKAFTATALGLLVDEGKITWQDKVHTFFPDLKLPDECMTKMLTVCDMLSHRTGLEEASFLWDKTFLSRKELIHRMRYLKSEKDFRTGWVYNNIMYMAAGEIIPVVTGTSWDDFVAQRFFGPLGMKRSNTSVMALEGVSNVAEPHILIDGQIHVIPHKNIDNVGPAGSINSTITDIAQWVKMLVNNGNFEGEQIIKPETLHYTHEPHTFMSHEYPYHLYGLGWGMLELHGHKVLFHEGNIDGMSAFIGLLPSKNVGLAVLTNIHKGFMGKVLVNYIFESFLGVKSGIDWNQKYLKEDVEKRDKMKQEVQERLAKRNADIKQSYSIEQFVGHYYSDLYGDLDVSLVDGNQLHVKFLAYDGILQHWESDVFFLDQLPLYPTVGDKFFFEFTGNKKRIMQVRVRVKDEVDGIFKKA